MTDDELATFKHEMFCLAMQRMMDCATWGRKLAGNCLPACLCILPEIKSQFPAATIVIGDIDKCGNNQPNLLDFQHFLKGEIDRQPSFHAWIDLGNGDLFDPVGTSWLNEGGTYLDASLAKKQGIHYYKCLTQAVDVSMFYQRLLYSRRGA